MKKVPLPIEQLHAFVDTLIESIAMLNDEFTQQKLEQAMTDDVAKELKKRNAEQHFKNLINSMKNIDTEKATYHARKLKKSIRYVSNDFPAQKGQFVYIKRHQHGWFNGSLSGKVKQVHGHPDGKKSYTVTVCEEYGEKCSPFDVYVAHTRDLCQ